MTEELRSQRYKTINEVRIIFLFGPVRFQVQKKEMDESGKAKNIVHTDEKIIYKCTRGFTLPKPNFEECSSHRRKDYLQVHERLHTS